MRIRNSRKKYVKWTIFITYIFFKAPLLPMQEESCTHQFPRWIRKAYAYELEHETAQDLAVCLSVAFTQSLNTLNAIEKVPILELKKLGNNQLFENEAHCNLFLDIHTHLSRFEGMTINKETFPLQTEDAFAHQVCIFFCNDRQRLLTMIQKVEKQMHSVLVLCNEKKN